jgi:molybdopterin-synthase adenylyltransferase
VKRADQEARQADGAGIDNRQVRLTATGGRDVGVASRPPSAPRYRLKRSVELFPAADGSIYLLRLGAGDDLVIEDPASAERGLLELLRKDSATETELATALQSQCKSADVRSSLQALRQAGVLEERRGERRLDGQRAERYDRQLIYFADLAQPGQAAEDLQLRLASAKVVVLGCGGLGSWVACGLSCAGVGALVLVDDDRVELSNLNRQLLFAEDDIGELKVEAAARALRRHNHELEVQPVCRRIFGAADLDDVLAQRPDLVVATADWPPHHLQRWVNQACLETSVPWIGAGQFPPRLRVGPLVVPHRSACFGCLEAAARRDYPLYDAIAEWRGKRETPDSSVGPVSAVIGSLLATEALHFLLGAFEPASVNHAVLLDLQTMALEKEHIVRDPECLACTPQRDGGQPGGIRGRARTAEER